MTGSLWLLVPAIVPLVAATVVGCLRRGRGGLVAVAAMPAVVLGLAGPGEAALAIDWVLLGMELHLDAVGRLFAVLAGVVWAAVGLSAGSLLRDHAALAAAFLVTMAGTVGVVLAGDVATLYASVTVMTFTAYLMVVHDRTASVLRAGRFYVVLAVLGEAALLAGLALAVGGAGGMLGFDEVREAVAAAPHRDLVLLLLFVGAGVKVGVVPLHVWLPLAHPAAPLPASAVLSGVLLKAGVVVWLRVLPIGTTGLSIAAAIVVAVGVITAVFGVVVGLTQQDTKTVLAYSSVSQMGIVTIAVGLALWAVDGAEPAMVAATSAALHHGLVKAALFLGVGLLGTQPSWRRTIVLAVAGTLALSLAGAPFTGGWLAKSAVKQVADASPGVLPSVTPTLLSLTSVATTVLMVHLVRVLLTEQQARQGRRGPVVAWAGLVLVAVTALWVVPPLVGASLVHPPWSVQELWGATWPVLAGSGIVVARSLVRRGERTGLPALPAGDIGVLFERAGAGVSSLSAAIPWSTVRRWVDRVGRARNRGEADLAALLGLVEERLTRWRVAGLLLALLMAALALAFGLPGGEAAAHGGAIRSG